MSGLLNSQESVDQQFNVLVARFGEDETPLRVPPATSVAQCLARAGIETPLPQGQSVSVNGDIVRDLTTHIQQDAVVVVSGNISNG